MSHFLNHVYVPLCLISPRAPWSFQKFRVTTMTRSKWKIDPDLSETPVVFSEIRICIAIEKDSNSPQRVFYLPNGQLIFSHLNISKSICPCSNKKKQHMRTSGRRHVPEDKSNHISVLKKYGCRKNISCLTFLTQI